MKIEKIQKHMDRRTVVVTTNPVLFGLIIDHDASNLPAKVAGRDSDGDVYEDWFRTTEIRKATPHEVAGFFDWLRSNDTQREELFGRWGGAPRGWEVEDKPAPVTLTPGKVYDKTATMAEREALVGRRVRAPEGNFGGGCKNGEGVVEYVDRIGTPYRVTGVGWCDEVQLIDESVPVTPPAPRRLTAGDKAIIVHDSGAVMGTIRRDDQDGVPYALEGISDMFRAHRAHPLTLDGFRGAHAAQKAQGVTPEEGDYCAIINGGDRVRTGTLSGGVIYCHDAEGVGIQIKGGEDWTDRVVVLTKRPKA